MDVQCKVTLTTFRYRRLAGVCGHSDNVVTETGFTRLRHDLDPDLNPYSISQRQ